MRENNSSARRNLKFIVGSFMIRVHEYGQLLVEFLGINLIQAVVRFDGAGASR